MKHLNFSGHIKHAYINGKLKKLGLTEKKMVITI